MLTFRRFWSHPAKSQNKANLDLDLITNEPSWLVSTTIKQIKAKASPTTIISATVQPTIASLKPALHLDIKETFELLNFFLVGTFLFFPVKERLNKIGFRA